MHNKPKIIAFSHENDIDGNGCILLLLMAFHNIYTVLASNAKELETKFRKLIDNKEIYEYERIFVTDLSLYNPSFDIVKNDPILSKKILIFDHHISAIRDGYDECDFATIVEVDKNGKKRCATDLVYEYLCKSKLLNRTKALDEFVELTRLEDTWEWKNANNIGQKAHDLAILFNEIGIDNYIGTLFAKLNKNENSFEFDKNEKEIIERKKQEYIKQLQLLWSESEFFTDKFGNYYAAVFADYELRNEICEYVRHQNIPNLKYIIIVALEAGEYGQKSYRSIENNFDVSKIAELYGGNGHPEAASVIITKSQKEETLTLKNKNIRNSLNYIINCDCK